MMLLVHVGRCGTLPDILCHMSLGHHTGNRCNGNLTTVSNKPSSFAPQLHHREAQRRRNSQKYWNRDNNKWRAIHSAPTKATQSYSVWLGVSSPRCDETVHMLWTGRYILLSEAICCLCSWICLHEYLLSSWDLYETVREFRRVQLVWWVLYSVHGKPTEWPTICHRGQYATMDRWNCSSLRRRCYIQAPRPGGQGIFNHR